MKSQKIIQLLTLVTMTSLSRASVVFQNDGTLSGWPHVLKDSGASITQVSSPTYKGSTALKHFANYSGSGDNSIHCEVAQDPAASNGDNRYYGWAFRIGSDFPSDYSRASALCQLTGHGACGFNQTDFIQIKGTSFVDHATGGNSCSQFTHDYTISGIPSRNVWHRLVVHKLWRGDNTGVLEIWLDGTKKVSASGIPTGYSDATSTYAWHIGVYAGFNSGSAGTRTVYTDHARITNNYTEADPAGW
jgi:Polysaccharide lyase